MSSRIECPDRAVLVLRELDGARHLVVGDDAGNREVESDVRDAMRMIVGGARGRQVRATAAQVRAAFLEDVDDVHRHAAGERESKRLHRGGPGRRRTIEW